MSSDNEVLLVVVRRRVWQEPVDYEFPDDEQQDTLSEWFDQVKVFRTRSAATEYLSARSAKAKKYNYSVRRASWGPEQ